jgi:hypothetical protein
MSQTVKTVFEGDSSAIEAAAKAAQEAINTVAVAEKALAVEVADADAALRAESKTLGTVAASAKSAGEATAGATTKAGKLADGAGKAGGSAMKLAGALSLISPAAGDSARNVGDLADVVEVAGEVGAALGVSLGAVATALGVVTAAAGLGYLAWKAYHQEETTAKEASDRLTASLKSLQPINELAASSALDLAHARGQVSDAEYAYQKALDSGAKARSQATEEAKKQIAANKALLDGLGNNGRLLDGTLTPRAQAYTDAIRDGTLVIEAAERAYGEVEGALLGVRDATLSAKAADEQAKREVLERKAAADSFLDAVHAMIDAENAEFRLSNERAKVAKANAKVIADAEAESAERRAEAEEELRVRRIEADEAYTEQVKQGTADREELNRQYAESAAAVLQESLALVEDIAERELDSRTETIETLQKRLEEGEDTLTKAQKEALKERIASNKEAALTAFYIAKAAAVAQAAISTALAVANALATPGVPYPVAIAFGVAAGIAGGASIAAILSEAPPKFHAGGEVSATLLPGEGVVNRQGMAALGGEGLNAINHGGRAPSGGVASFRVGRLEAKEIARTDIRANGAIPQAIRSFVNRSSNGTGLSGRLAIR